ncbi:MAG TPA: hypothetical protein VD833_10545 [Vicinamibacterales bacterium]|nr:hypothetical protein [Vicinamibacterales bacterium]
MAGTPVASLPGGGHEVVSHDRSSSGAIMLSGAIHAEPMSQPWKSSTWKFRGRKGAALLISA